jgi:outer membrane protein assembly factor BamB
MSQDQYLLHRDGLGKFLLQSRDIGVIQGRLFPAMPGESARAFSYDYGSVWYPKQILNLKDFPELSEMPFFTIESCNYTDLDRYFQDIKSQSIWPLLGVFGKFIGYSPIRNQISPTSSDVLWKYAVPNPQGSWVVPIFGLWVNRRGCWLSNRDGWILEINHQGEIIQKHQLSKLTRCVTGSKDSLYVGCDDGQIYELTEKIPQPIYNMRPPDNYWYSYQIFALEKTADSLLIADAYGKLICLDPSLEIQWQQQRSECWQGYLLCADLHRVYQGYYRGLICYDKSTGQFLWEQLTDAPVLCGTVLEKKIIVGCSDRNIYALSKNGNSQLSPKGISTIFTCKGMPYAICATSDQQSLFISDYNWQIYRLDVQGNLQGIITLDCGAAMAMQIWNARLYAGTTQGVVVCVALDPSSEGPPNFPQERPILPSQRETSAGVILKCFKKGTKLKIRPCSSKYNQDWNVAFPKHLRVEGARYRVDGLKESKQGGFYRVVGQIEQLESFSNQVMYRSE